MVEGNSNPDFVAGINAEMVLWLKHVLIIPGL